MTINEAITAVLSASHHGDQHFRSFLRGDDPEVLAMRAALVQLADAVREDEEGSEFIRLTHIDGLICLRKSSIGAIANHGNAGKPATNVKSDVWLHGQDDPFYIHEDVDTICRLIE